MRGRTAWRRPAALGAVLLTVAGSGCSVRRDRVEPAPAATTPAATASAGPAVTSPVTASPSTPGRSTPTAAPTTSPVAPAPTRAVLPAGLLGHDWERIPTASRVVALTFDAGANADGVPSILATLARERVPATFFLTGAFVRAFPDRARQIAASANPVGNHSVDHPHFPPLSDAAARAEVVQAARTIRTVPGLEPGPWFRFPYGDRTAHDIALVNDLGYVAVRWTVDTLGWKGTSAGVTAATVRDRVLDALRPGAIVLMHVGSHPTDHSTLDADALPSLIRALRDRGYGFVTLRALTG